MKIMKLLEGNWKCIDGFVCGNDFLDIKPKTQLIK